MTGVRVVQARAAAHRRKTEGIDLVAAYTQVRLGGEVRYFMIIPKNVVSALDPEARAIYEAMSMPVVELGRAVYGLGRSGHDFIGTFAGWLNLNAWYTVPEEPALHVYWATEEPGVILKRAAANKKYVEAELKHGRNVLLERPQKAGLFEDKEKMQLEKVKRVAGSEQKAVVMRKEGLAQLDVGGCPHVLRECRTRGRQ